MPVSQCKPCKVIVDRECRQKNKDNPTYWIHRRATTYLPRSAREQGLPYDLTSEYLIGLYDQQKGLCYYTGVPLQFGVVGRDGRRPSVDRLSPALGYVQGNVVWCTAKANLMKQNFTEEEFYAELRKILGIHQEKSANEDL